MKLPAILNELELVLARLEVALWHARRNLLWERIERAKLHNDGPVRVAFDRVTQTLSLPLRSAPAVTQALDAAESLLDRLAPNV